MGWSQKYNSLTILSDSLGFWMGRNKKPIESYTWECETLLLLCFETNPLRLTSVGAIGLNGKNRVLHTWENVELFFCCALKQILWDFCRIHWVEWEQTHGVLYLRECGSVLKTICKSTKFCILLWLKKYGFWAIAAEFWMPLKDHPSLCLTIHGCVCVCVCVCAWLKEERNRFHKWAWRRWDPDGLLLPAESVRSKSGNWGMLCAASRCWVAVCTTASRELATAWSHCAICSWPTQVMSTMASMSRSAPFLLLTAQAAVSSPLLRWSSSLWAPRKGDTKIKCREWASRGIPQICSLHRRREETSLKQQRQ